MFAQGGDVAGVEQFHGTAKFGVFNAFVMLQVQPVGESGLFNVALQPGPAGKAAFARDGELRIAEG